MKPRLTIDSAARVRRAILHPLAGSSYRHFAHLLRWNGHLSPASRLQRWVSAAGLLSRVPASIFEQTLRRKAIDAHELGAPPVFIIGHWGSGTTFLHHLICRDPALGYLDFGHALMPWNMFETSRYMRFYIRPLIPPKRRFDDVPLGLEDPQEEEMALACLSTVSFFHTFYFPQAIEAHTRRALFLESLDQRDRDEFERAYRLLARRLSLCRGGKRLVFKSPASMTRIPFLRRIFPGAKFIHIVRNPFEIFASALNRLPTLFSEFALQPFAQVPLESYILDTYEAVMRRFLQDRTTIPEGDLFETRFETLVSDPVGEIGKAYEALSLQGWEIAGEAIQAHLVNRAPCSRLPRSLTRRETELVINRCAVVFDGWNYSRDPANARIVVSD